MTMVLLRKNKTWERPHRCSVCDLVIWICQLLWSSTSFFGSILFYVEWIMPFMHYYAPTVWYQLLVWYQVYCIANLVFVFFFSYSQCVPIMFPWDSQVFPKDVPNTASDLSHMVCLNFNSSVYKLKRWARPQLPLFCNSVPKRCFYCRVHNIPKKLVMGQSVPQKRKGGVSAPVNELIWLTLPLCP
jgi:hypothetical protein